MCIDADGEVEEISESDLSLSHVDSIVERSCVKDKKGLC